MLVSSVTQQVWLTKLFGWGLRAISGIIVILAVVYLVQVLPTLGQNTVIPIIQNMAIYFIIAVGVAWFSGHFFKIATEREQNLDERLLGYVLAGNLVNFEALAGWTRITQQDVANRLAKLSSSGMLRDYQIDLQNRMVTKIGVASSNSEGVPGVAATEGNLVPHKLQYSAPGLIGALQFGQKDFV